jgi:putative addiction module CopG family antidote
MNVKTRNVSLTPEIDDFIAGRIASGRFGSASEVVRAALRLLEEEERRRETSIQDPVSVRNESAR